MSVIMSDYYKSYCNFINICSNVQRRTIEDNINDYPVIENLLGFHYWLQDQVGKIYNDMDDPARFASSGFVHVMFSHNFLSFYAIFLALEKSLLHQARALTRNVIESIPKMNYMGFFPEEAPYILFRDYMQERNKGKIEKEFDAFKSQISPDFQTIDRNKALKSIQRYSFRWFSERVYKQSTFDSMYETYRQLSTDVHPSSRRLQNNYEKEQTTLEITALKFLLFYNILAEVEGHGAMIRNNLFPYRDTCKFLEKMEGMLSRDGQMQLWIPDNPNILSKVIRGDTH